MATAIKRLLVGRALRTEQAAHERLTKKTALAVFSSDALSSTAYATEEILLVLAAAAAATSGTSFGFVVPVSVGIAVLLGIVATKHAQMKTKGRSRGRVVSINSELLRSWENDPANASQICLAKATFL